jgi:hypothetical protein
MGGSRVIEFVNSMEGGATVLHLTGNVFYVGVF